MKILRPFMLLLTTCIASAQDYSSSSIFSHNDYEHRHPFSDAYDLGVGFIEADVFLINNTLLVAHTKEEVQQSRTLEALYLKPIRDKIKMNKGRIYDRDSSYLTLMIDLKTEGLATLNAIVERLTGFPELLSCPTFSIVISGNVPDRSLWKNFPSYILFDGRPGITYSDQELERVAFISTNFRDHSSWNGEGEISSVDRDRIVSLLESVHSKNKKLRFWGAPDLPSAWELWMKLGVDIIGTDRISDLTTYLKNR